MTQVLPGFRASDPELLAIYGRVVRTGQPEKAERYVHALNLWFNVSVFSPEPEHFVAVFDVVNQRKAEQAALRASEEQFRTMFELAAIGMAQADPRTGQWLRVNQKMCDITGYPAEEMLQLRIPELTHPEDREKDWQAFQSVMRGDRPNYWMEKRYIRKDGSVVWVNVNVTVIRDAAGAPLRTMATIEDIHQRKQAEAQLRDSEEKFHQLADNIRDVFWIASPDFKVLHYVSRGYETIWGRPVANLYQHPQEWLEAILPEDRERVCAMSDALSQDTAEVDVEYRVARPDGMVRWIRGRGFQVRDGAGEVVRITGIATDITERKRAEEKLFQTGVRIRHLNSVLHAIREIGNLLNREKNFHRLLTAVCQSLVKTRGYVTVWVGRPETGPTGSKLVVPLAHSGGDAAFLQHAKITWDDSPLGQGPTGLAIRKRRLVVFGDIARDPRFAPWRELVMAGGTASVASIPIIHGDELFGALTIKADQTDAFDAEEEALLTGLAADMGRALHNLETEAASRQVAEAHARLATAVEQAAEAIVITDTAGTILYVNPAFERNTGYLAAEVLGQNPRILKSGKQDAGYYQQMWVRLRSGQTWSGHFSNRRKDGSLFEEEATISPIRDTGGKVISYVAVKRDVSREVELEAQFRQAQKMEAVGQLAGGVAHDFNNILAVIQMQAGLIRMDSPAAGNGAGQWHEYASEIEKACQRAANLTNQLLLFSRKQPLQLRDQDLNEVITSIAKMLQRILGEQIRMEIKLAPQSLLVHADAGMMDQLMMNLTVNARDAMPQGGALELETTVVEFDEVSAAQKPRARPGTFACVRVGDTGCGIAPEVLPRIFEPFFTTKEPGKGTGLGLATVFGIVQQHHGWIEVASEVGRGTVFRIYLPRLSVSANKTADWSSFGEIRPGHETILLVEDDAALRDSMRGALSRLGYEVLPAGDGAEAMTAWKANRASIRLLVADLVLPGGMSGKELADLLLQQEPNLKVVYASGYRAEISDEGLEENVNFLAKPFEMRQLAQTVRNCLDKG